MGTVVLGAGPAGLSAAERLDGDVTVVERETEVGGLCRSFEVGGATFDYDGHAFFTGDDEVRDHVVEGCTPGVHAQPRNAWVWSHGTLVPYPLQSNLYGLPTEVVRDALVGLIEAGPDQPPSGRPANLRQWLTRSFGHGLCDAFFFPYNEKLWAHPLDEIVPVWTGDRIVRPDVVRMIEGALSRQPFSDYPNAVVRYPAEGGFCRLYEPFADRVGWPNIVRGEVVAIDLGRRLVETGDGNQVGFDHLISTLPLDELCRIVVDLPDDLRAKADELAHNSLQLVSLALDAPADSVEIHRLYCADPAVPFHKVVFNNTSSNTLGNGPTLGVQAEISYSIVRNHSGGIQAITNIVG